jgi:glycosyltransferase involved in cell wall biosynthesis
MSQVNSNAIHPWLLHAAYRQNQPGSILFHAGSGVFQSPGGGEVQLIKTGEALEQRGFPVGLFNPWLDRLGEHRLIHFFGLHREALPLAKLAKKAGIGVVVSPICWYDPLAQWHEAHGWVDGAARVSKWFLLRHCWPARSRSWRFQLLTLADRILPNSEAEADQLVRLFGVDRARIRVVPNAVDTHQAIAPTEQVRQRIAFQEYVLYVGRIEHRKNVIGLIDSCIAADKPLVIIGRGSIESAEYEAVCRKLAEGRKIQFLGSLSKTDPLLISAMASARVFALPSWFETPGLAALEAAALGTQVVITSRGATREYFGDFACYCDPLHPNSIKQAIVQAWDNPISGREQLAERIRREWTWQEVARIMEGIYDAVT